MILTIGHSTRTIDEFIELLRAHRVEQLVDVRTIPKSRRNPQFESSALAQSLANAGIAYRHMPGLGGLRHPHKDSINAGWKNDSFRGYADYMQTAGFEASLNELIKAANTHRTAIMCAEAVPWRCHRSLIADALKAREQDVEHIMSKPSDNKAAGDKTGRKPHTFTPFAKIDGTRVTYPGLPGIAPPGE